MFFSLTASACSGDDDPANEPPKEENPQEGEDEGGGNGEIDYSKVGLEYDDGENLIFHVKIAIDKEGASMRSMDYFKENLKKQWDDINVRFNALDKKNELKRNYIFVPDLDGIIIYNYEDADSHWSVPSDYASQIDFNKYQCLVAYDFVVQEGEGGGGCGDDGKGMANILVVNANKSNIGKFYDHFQSSANTVAAITHELGHFRGIWDLYVINLNGSNNAVNGQGFQAPDGVMNNNTYGPIEEVYWNEYEILCLNACLARKEYRLFDTCLWEYFPDNIEVHVTEGGQDVKDGFKLNFYAIENYKIDTTTDRPQKTAALSTLRMDARDLFWYGDAYWQWTPMFLLEAVSNATGKKGYAFLPYYEVHMQGLKDKSASPIEGKSTYKLTINIE